MGIFPMEVILLEITLFNQSGSPTAYIDKTRKNAIFLWDGHAVGYIEEGQVFSLKGDHIGWFEDDVFYNAEGFKLAATKWACPMVTAYEPNKPDKFPFMLEVKADTKKMKKVLKNAYGHETLVEYLNKYR